MEALSLEGEGWVRVTDTEVGRDAFASLPLTPALSPPGRGSAASINLKQSLVVMKLHPGSTTRVGA